MAISAEDLELIIQLWNNDKSSREIGAQFGVSRNSIVGLIHRARARGREVKIKNPDTTKEALIKRGINKSYHHHTRKRGKTKKTKTRGLNEMLIAKENTIYNLEPGDCRYPTVMSENNEQLFCAASRHLSSPYCEEHHNLCINVAADKRLFRMGPKTLKFT